jgi:tRNA(Ile)-lysidine synthase
VDLSAVDFDFELRNRKDGDIIQPFGMNGHQKLKKYLNSKKIPNHKKDELIFLAQGNEILWAVDLGLSDKIKVTTKPTHKIEVKINGN